MKNLYLNGHTVKCPRVFIDLKSHYLKNLFKYSLIILFFTNFINTADSQCFFLKSYDSDAYVFPALQGGKVWLEVINVNEDESNSGPHQIELISYALRMVDPTSYGYTETIHSYDDFSGTKVFSYLYVKSIADLEIDEHLTDVTYYYKDPDMQTASNQSRVVHARVKNTVTNEYLKNLNDVSEDEAYINFWYPDFIRYVDVLFDLNTNNEGSELFASHDSWDSGRPAVKPADVNSVVNWIIKGKIYFDVPYQTANDEYKINGTNFGWHFYDGCTNCGLHYNFKCAEILLLDANSVFEIREDARLIATGLAVRSGGVDMAKGIVVYPGAKLSIYNSLFEDQITAITLIGDAELELYNTYFTDNEVAIHVIPGESGEVASIKMDEVTFAARGNLKTRPNNRFFPYAHIKVEEGASVKIDVLGGDNSVVMLESEYGIHSEGTVNINGGTIDFTQNGFPSLALGSFATFGLSDAEYPYGNYYGVTKANLYTPATPGIGISSRGTFNNLSTLNIEAESANISLCG